MSAICILTPTIIAAWPAISAAVAGAAAALGFSLVREGARAYSEAVASVENVQGAAQATVEVAVENSEVLGENIATEQEIVLVKGDTRVRVCRDLRGSFKVCVDGSGQSREELQEVGERVVEKITQMYVYNKVMTELKDKGFTIVNEGVAEDETVHIHVRQQVL